MYITYFLEDKTHKRADVEITITLSCDDTDWDMRQMLRIIDDAQKYLWKGYVIKDIWVCTGEPPK